MKYQLASDSFNDDEINAAIAVLKSGQYSMGSKVKEFESAFAEFTGSKHAVMVNSGSSANLLLVEALLRRTNANPPLQPGDEVLVPALSWPTTVWPVTQLGLVPVFVDVDPNTLAIDLEKAQAALSPRTKGMFLIHVLGQAAPMDKFQEFCSSNNITLLEDCCETLGAYSKGKHVGTFGMGASFSHFFSHHLTTIDGGTIVTDDGDLANDLRSFRAHGWIRDRNDKEAFTSKYPHIDPRFFFVTTGYNVRPTEINAAIGLVQIRKIKDFISSRRNIADKVNQITKRNTPWIRLIGSEFLEGDKFQSHSWMNIPFIIEDQKISLRQTTDILEAAGVETRPIIAGNLASHPAVKKIQHRIGGDLSTSNQILEKGFMIGCNPDTSTQQLEILENAFKSLNSKT